MCSSDLGSPAVLGFGYGLAAGSDLDGDGVPDLVVGTLGAEAADGVYVFSGAAGLAGGVLTEGDAFAHLVPEEAERGRFGTALSLGDHDGDGAADVVVQDNDEDERFFLFANATLRGGTVASSAADWIYEPHDADTIVGGGVRLDGDLDGDGAAEFVYADASWGPYGYDSGFGMAMVFP